MASTPFLIASVLVLALIAHSAIVPEEPVKINEKEESADLKEVKDAALEKKDETSKDVDQPSLLEDRENDDGDDDEEDDFDSLKAVLRRFISEGLDGNEDNELEELKREPWGRRRCTNSICRRRRSCQRSCRGGRRRSRRGWG